MEVLSGDERVGKNNSEMVISFLFSLHIGEFLDCSSSGCPLLSFSSL
jgi:hypothetical protein